MEYLRGRFGQHDDLVALAHLLLPNRAPFFETNVSVDLEDREGSDDLFFKYRLDFKARVDRVLFAVSDSPAVTESLLASIPEITEVTTLSDGDSLDTQARLLLEGDLQISLFETTNRGTGRFRDLQLHLLDERQVNELASQTGSSVPVRRFRVISTATVASATRPVRVAVSMTRRLNEDIWCLPWLVDRPIFLQTFTVDARACRRRRHLETYPFMTTNERAYAVPLAANDRVVLHLNQWLTVGQGIMMAWRPQRA